MTSRERVLKAINFEETDRVPIDLDGMGATGIAVEAYIKLIRHLGIDEEPVKIYNVPLMLARPSETIRKRFHVDTLQLGIPWEMDVTGGERWQPWKLFDGTEVLIPVGITMTPSGDGGWLLANRKGENILKMPKDGYYFDAFLPTPPAPTVEEFNPPDRFEDHELDFLNKEGKRLFETTDCAILGMHGGGLFNLVGDFEEWMCRILLDKDYVRRLAEKMCDALIRRTKQFNDACGEYIFAFVLADDLGTQRSEYIRPELFEELFAPVYKRYCSWVHENTNLKVFLHSCGSIFNLIDILIDCGVDILNPLQTSADNMDPVALKERYGGRIVFWGGGCDTQRVLPFGTAQEVYEHVKERIRIFAPGGGFVFNQVQDIQSETPPENLVAMWNSAYENGKYPIAQPIAER